MRKVSVIASASGCGKTTLAMALAEKLALPYVEFDAFMHKSNWGETSDDEMRALVEPIVASDGWVLDGSYDRKLGNLVFDSADTIVWIDLPIRIWMPRLLRRSARRLHYKAELWNGNRETMRGIFWGRKSLVIWAIRSHVRRRREWPTRFAAYPLVRLRSQREVDEFLEQAGA